MKLYQYTIISWIVGFVGMIYLVYHNGGSIAGWDYYNISLYYIVGGILFSYITYKSESKSELTLSEKFERTERICNACRLPGGKMSCNAYKMLDGVVNKCPLSSNPEGNNL